MDYFLDYGIYSEAATRILRLKDAFTEYERRTMLAKNGNEERYLS